MVDLKRVFIEYLKSLYTSLKALYRRHIYKRLNWDQHKLPKEGIHKRPREVFIKDPKCIHRRPKGEDQKQNISTYK